MGLQWMYESLDLTWLYKEYQEISRFQNLFSKIECHWSWNSIAISILTIANFHGVDIIRK